MEIDDCLSQLLKQEPKTWIKTNEIKYRSQLGDSIDLFVLKNLQNHVLLYDPSLLSNVYKILFPKIKEEMAKWIENIGLRSFFLEEFEKLEKNKKIKIIRSLFEEHLNKITTNLGIGILKVSEINFKEDKIKIVVKECAEAHNTSKIGHPICFNSAAFISGMIGGIFPEWQCFEKKCKSTGAEDCVFLLAPQEKINEEIREFLDLPSRISFTLGGKISSMISEFQTEIDYTPLLEESVNRISQLFPDMKSKGRSDLGNELSLRGFQQYYLSFLSENAEYSSDVLYKAGETSGKRFSRILSALGIQKKDKINIMPRFFDRLGIGLLNIKKEGKSYKAKVKECGFSYKLDTEDKICFFNSGFFAGFLSNTTGKNYFGDEKTCSGETGDYCVHEIDYSKEQQD